MCSGFLVSSLCWFFNEIKGEKGGIVVSLEVGWSSQLFHSRVTVEESIVRVWGGSSSTGEKDE